ncbi:DNA-directed RNA polymerase [Melia azedarach]|uniref:DNA-directed RNA polymerase n=1 Tax=Melia azedarach TaxID=155640 RepID=A0ACC1XTV7_MELAZ|nr:DNA-directed RNA polymerase [Melia azedarach]
MASVSRATALPQFQYIPSPAFHHRRNSIHSNGMLRVHAAKIATDGGRGRLGNDQIVYGPDLLRKPVVSLPDDQCRAVNWEDQILSDTVPLVGVVRMILHSGSGERLTPEHEEIVVKMLLPYHPKYEEKIGGGIDHIKVGNHPDFEGTRCLFIVQKGGELMDFSYWKCIKGLIKKKYPLHADCFILRHFRRHWRRE